MLLDETHVVQLRGGVTGDIAGRVLTRLGAQVTRVTLSPWRAGHSKANTQLSIPPVGWHRATANGSTPP